METGMRTAHLCITEFRLPVASPFDFHSTIHSHGWIELPPFAPLHDNQGFSRFELLPSGTAVALEVSAYGGYPHRGIRVKALSESPLDSDDQKVIASNVSHMLRLDEDFSEFYALCHRKGGAWKGLTKGRGRLLRSPTIFEDLVKVICTTNVQWSGTRRMAAQLVSAFGTPAPALGDGYAFPPPRAIAQAGLQEFAARTRLGYRAAYIHALAEEVADGKLCVESWLDPKMPAREVKNQLMAIKGVGKYAAASMLMLLGRYADIPVDTEFQKFMSQKYFGGAPFEPERALAIYQDWGEWKALAYWLDMISG
jgi:3-methyladenine DNA glycosylase/8-oxoguanine DNA glycosylase